MSLDFLRGLASKSPRLSELFNEISSSIMSVPPYGLGYPSDVTQSAYYMGPGVSESDVQMVSKILERNSVFPENTRIRKADNGTDFEVLVASVDSIINSHSQSFPLPNGKGVVKLVGGDHSASLEQVCAELSEAAKYAANDRQRAFVDDYIESFQTGSLDTYRNALRTWVQDKAPRVENIFGFVEPYRDPHGTRSEFEALVAIADDKETQLLGKLVDNSAKFIRRLPWAAAENDGKGPFEKNLFEPPDFSSIHSTSWGRCLRLSLTPITLLTARNPALAYCSSIIFPGINLPNVRMDI